MQMFRGYGFAAAVLLCAAPATADDGIGPFTNGVAVANPAEGSPHNVISSDFFKTMIATGTDSLENSSGDITMFGKLADGTNTEPDQNLYLTIDTRVPGPTLKYNYGRHFLIQGHEAAGNKAYVTRINLDVTDKAHRITLLTPEGGDGFTHFNSMDGSAWDPISGSMLFTQESSGTAGGVLEVSTGYPATVTTHNGSMGRCGQGHSHGQ